MFGFPSRLSCHATSAPAVEFLTTIAWTWSIAVAGVLSLTRAGVWNVAPVLIPDTNHAAAAVGLAAFQYAAETWVPLRSKDTYFLSLAALSIVPVIVFTRFQDAAPPGVFVEYTARISKFGARLVLKKSAPTTARFPSTDIEGQTKVFDGQKFPHISPSWAKKFVTPLNRNHVRSHAVLSKISISIPPTRSFVTLFQPDEGWKSSTLGVCVKYVAVQPLAWLTSVEKSM